MCRIQNGKVYNFKTDNLFIQKVRAQIPIELTIQPMIISKVYKNIHPIDKLLKVYSRSGKEGLQKYTPTLSLVLFPSSTSNKRLKSIFHSDKFVTHKIIAPFLDALSTIVPPEDIVSNDMSMESYERIDSLQELEEYIQNVYFSIEHFFDVLNENIEDVQELLEEMYEKIGMMASRQYVVDNMKDPDIIYDYEDDGMLGIFKSGFSTTYLFSRWKY